MNKFNFMSIFNPNDQSCTCANYVVKLFLVFCSLSSDHIGNLIIVALCFQVGAKVIEFLMRNLLEGNVNNK